MPQPPSRTTRAIRRRPPEVQAGGTAKIAVKTEPGMTPGDGEDTRPTLANSPAPQTELKAPEGRPLAEIKARLTTAWSSVSAPSDPNATVSTATILNPGSMIGFVARTRVLVEAGTGEASTTGADYELGERLGAGGMGEVYLSRQVSLGREIALKILRENLGTRQDVQVKFLLEAAVTAELEHPGIVPVYDLGVDHQRRAFYAMKLVKGTTWSDVIDQRPQAENIEILLKVCDALAFAHSKGVIHRDLKPDNIMLGEFGEVQVLDWGLAAAVAPGSSAPPLQATGLIAGTPSYMSPEMALGETDRIGFASDIYLLGGMLYRLLTGAPPHTGNDTRMVVLAAARNHIERVSGGELISIALRALSTDPAHRHASVQEFQRDLRRFQEHHASIELGRLAGADLERAESEGHYEDFAQAVSSFREALRLWDGNAVAQVGLEAAQFAYAGVALKRGDLDLADSLLTDQIAEHQRMRAQVAALRRQRDQRHKRQKIQRLVALGLTAALLVSLAGGALISSYQERRAHQAEAERDAEKVHALEAEVTANQIAATAAAKVKRRSLAFAPYSLGMDRLMRGEGHFAEAAEGLRQALALDPDFSEAHFALGEALRLGGEPVAAEASYLKADAIDRQVANQPNIRALLMAGFACLDSFENQRAHDFFAQADELGHDDPLALTGRSLVQAFDGKLLQARSTAQQAVAQAPLLWETHAALGCISWGIMVEGMESPDSILPTTIAALRQSLQLSPNQPVIRIFLARALNKSNRPEDRAQLATLITAPAHGLVLHPSLRIEHAVALIEAGNVDQAEQELNQAEKDGAPPTTMRYGRIGLARARGNWEACYSQLASLIHDQESIAVLVGNWVRLGLHLPEHRKEVIDFFAAWRQRHPDLPSCSLIAAQIALEGNDLPTAQSELAKAVKLTPFRAEIVVLQIDLLRRAGKKTEAMELLKTTVAARPQDFDLRLVELEVLAKSGDLVQALDRLDALEKDFPNRAADIARLKARMMK